MFRLQMFLLICVYSYDFCSSYCICQNEKITPNYLEINKKANKLLFEMVPKGDVSFVSSKRLFLSILHDIRT
jgi:hypothetical protein